jgi:AAHS family 4-hydroxybenzoate transporter-like MFS transporter
MQSKLVDITRVLDDQKIGPFQIRLLILSFIVMMIDGYDIGAAAFAGPSLIREWSLRGPELGVLFSATLISGLIGSPLLGYLSDRFGRKRIIVYASLYFGLLTTCAVLATSVQSLTLLRFFAGIGIAGMLPVVVALNNEFAPRGFRATMVVLMFTGVTFGGGLPGLVAAKFIPTLGWHVLFWAGGIGAVVISLLLAFTLPESVKYLALKPERRDDLVKTLAAIQPDIAIGPDTQFVITGEENQPKFRMSALFEGRLALLTPLFWISNAICLMVFYFINQWMPTLLATDGIPVAHAAIATTLFQFGGTLAGLVTMRLLDKHGFVPVPVLFALAIPVVALIGLRGFPEGVVITLIAAAGFCLLGLQFGNIASEANVYPTYIRTWGVGSCFAAGRVGSAIGPLTGGYLFAKHVPLQETLFIAAVPLFIGLVASIAIVPLYRKQIESEAQTPAYSDTPVYTAPA